MTKPEDDKKLIDGLSLNRHSPTTITLDHLFHWVVWQYPRRRPQGYCGAVRPPSGGWYPALVSADQKRVLIYGHLPETFESPELASKHLDSLLA